MSTETETDKPWRTGPAAGPVRVVCLLVTLLLAGCDDGAAVFHGNVVSGGSVPSLTGVNWNGEPFSLDSQRGKVTVVFFGYTYCPDVCPFALAKMKQLNERLGPRAQDLAVVFASVDPYRDTVEKMAQYVPHFNRDFYGVRLDFDDIEAAKDQFDLTVQYGQPKDGPGTESFYYVDHTGVYFLLDREGRLRVKAPPNATVDDLYADIKTLLDA